MFISGKERSDVQKTITLKSDEEALKLFGKLDEHISFAESSFNVQVTARGHKVMVRGDDANVKKAEKFFLSVLRAIRRGDEVDDYTLNDFLAGSTDNGSEVASGDVIFTTYKKKAIGVRSSGQEIYINEIRTHDIVLGIGPAGTGKTYLAVACALAALKRRQVQRLILTRPAVEAGESLGFLPGDMYAKINPYLRPLYDALYEMLGFDEVAQLLQRGVIEIAPLAYMRGRTLNDSFIILDEAQNATPQQMKMFLTRLGFSSKCVITGDITQIDLPHHTNSGLVEVGRILKTVKGISIVTLSEKDVVRHPLVKEIIKAYEKEEKRRKKTKKKT